MPISFDDVEMSPPSATLLASWEALRAERASAARAVASAAVDAADCARLLEILGLSAGDGLIDLPRPRGYGARPGDRSNETRPR
jgi:hypothetical protein